MKEKEKFNREYYKRRGEEYEQFEEQSELQKPIIEKLEAIQDAPKLEEEEHTFEVKFDTINDFDTPLIPHLNKEVINGKVYYGININSKKYIFMMIGGVQYLVNYKNYNEAYPWTDNLKLIIEGRGKRIPRAKESKYRKPIEVDMDNYFRIMN